MLYTLIRVIFVLGTFVLCSSNSIVIMTISKFFIGLAYMPMFIMIFWYECHNLLPQHRQRAFNINSTLGAFCIMTTSGLAYFDPGNWFFWRACHMVFALLLALSLALEFTILKNINCISFFTQNGKYSEAEECLKSYIGRETVEKMIQIEKNEQPKLSEADSDQIQSSILLKKSNFSMFLEDLRKYKKDVAYVIFIYLLCTGSFYDLAFGLSTYLGAKEMSDISAVKETKKWVSMGLTGKLAFASFLSYVVPNKKRKEVLELGHTVGLCLMLGISVTYLLQRLDFSNICIFLFLVTSAGWYPTLFIYPNDILKPSLSSIAYIIKSLIDSVLFLVVPNYLKFELRSKREIGVRLSVLVFVGVVSNIILRFWLVETYDPTRSTKYSVMAEEEEEIVLEKNSVE